MVCFQFNMLWGLSVNNMHIVGNPKQQSISDPFFFIYILVESRVFSTLRDWSELILEANSYAEI